MRLKADALRSQPVCNSVVRPYMKSPHERRGLCPN
jgi:hypothetical protein